MDPRQTVVDDSELVEKLRVGHRNILKELRKVIIAQDSVVDLALISLLVVSLICRHCS